MTSPSRSTGSKHDPYAAFRIRTYRLYACGWTVALMGVRIQAVAIGWEMYERTDRALALGLVGLVQAFPSLVLALPAGHLADTFNRRNVVLCGLIGTTATSLGLARCSEVEGSIAFMYFLLFLDAIALAVARPARMALLPQLVPSHIFPNAVTWNASIFHFASVFGPAIGGFLVAVSLPAAYVISAASTLFFILVLVRIKIPDSVSAPSHTGGGAILGGLTYLWRTRVLLAIITLDMFAVLLGGAIFLLPIFAKDLNVGATGLGWLNAAPAAGALIMALILAYRPPMQRAGRNLLFAVAGFGAATIVFGFSRSFCLSLLMLLLTGAMDNVSVVVRHTLVQMLTPDHIRGRVSAINSVFIGASNELGGLESGLVAHFFGPVTSVVSGGVGTIVVVIATALGSPQVRAIRSLTDLEPPDMSNRVGSSTN